MTDNIGGLRARIFNFTSLADATAAASDTSDVAITTVKSFSLEISSLIAGIILAAMNSMRNIMQDGLGNVGDTIRSALGLVVRGAGAILNQSVVSANALFELFGSSPTSGTKGGPVFGDTGILLAVLCAAVTNDDPTSD